MDLVCKIFGFFLNLFSKVVTVVAQAVKILGDATVDVLTDLVTSVGDGVFSSLSGSGLLGWLLVGGAAYFFLTRDDKKESNPVVVQQARPMESNYTYPEGDTYG